jgi:UDP-N-acetylglucosamine 2-epimerase (non-hydrolysing)
VIDHSSSVLMPYTNRSRENLTAEGFPGNRVYVTGNPIKQIIDHFSEKIAASTTLEELDLERGKFFLVTLHRAENVDIESRLQSLLEGLVLLQAEFGFPVVCSLHPRTRSKMEAFGIDLKRAGLWFLEPLGFFDFVRLEQSAFCLLSDSGTVQEETCIFGVPNVTIRDVTERPETLDCGSNILCGVIPVDILRAVRMVTAQSCRWNPPEEYMVPAVAETVCRIVLGYRIPDMAELAWHGGSGTQ